MKNKPIFLLLALFIPFMASAQWSTDKAKPLPVCTGTGFQDKFISFKDSADGYFIFWIDNRNSPSKINSTNNEIYGQHLDVNGNYLWPAEGKLFVKCSNASSALRDFSALMTTEGKLLLCWSSGVVGSDSLRAMLYSSTGKPLWANPTLIAGRKLGSSIIYTDGSVMLRHGSGAYIAYHNTYVGGSDNIILNRIDKKGNLLWSPIDVGITYAGPFDLKDDGTGNGFIFWRGGNGSGSHLFTQRFDSTGHFLWNKSLDVTYGTKGLSYQFQGASDNKHGLFLTWESAYPYKSILFTRVDTLGHLSFPVDTVCVTKYDKMNPQLVWNDGYLYISWADSRPPASNYNVYVQKYNINGTALWTKNGVRASKQDAYAPYPLLTENKSGGVVFGYTGTYNTGFKAQWVKSDSTLAWSSDGNGIQVGTTSVAPNYNDFVLYSDSKNNIVSIWHYWNGSNFSKLYASRISHDTVTSIQLNKTSATIITGNTLQLKATLVPADTAFKAVLWTSDNNSVASVSEKGLVTAIKAGSASIKATAADGGKFVTCAITVNNPVIPVTSVSLLVSKALKVDSSFVLTPVITPANATNTNVNWVSENPAIATVSSTGVVVGKSVGQAVISVTTQDGNFKASCTVTVSTTLGVEVNKQVNVGCNLFPNPALAGTPIMVELKGQYLKEEIEINITDAAGKLILKQKLRSANNLFEIKEANLSRGTYLINISTPTGVVKKKLVVE